MALFFELNDVKINLEYLDTISELVIKFLEKRGESLRAIFDYFLMTKVDQDKTEIDKASKKEKLFFEQKMIIALSMIDYNDL